MIERIGWKNILEGLGVLALVASLMFVGFQLQQDRNLAAAQVIVNADAVRNELLALIVENREVWLRGLEGEELATADEIAFQAIAAAHFHRYLGISQRFELLGVSGHERVAERYAFSIHQFPPLRQLFMQESLLLESRNQYFNRGGFSYREQVIEHLDELDRSPPELQDKTVYPY